MYGGPGTRSDFPVHLHMYKLVEYLPLGSSLRLLRWVPNSDRALHYAFVGVFSILIYTLD